MSEETIVASDALSNDDGIGQIACQRCDMLLRTPILGLGEQATCPGCGGVIGVRSFGGSGVSLACALAAVMMLALACIYPFLTLESSGLAHQISLISLAETMSENGRPLVALGTILLILIIPLIMMLLNILVLIPYHFDLGAPDYIKMALRWSHYLAHWSMVDVFVIGVLASLTKIVSLADVAFEVGFWAYMLFAVLVLVSLWHFDRTPLWQWIEPHKSQAGHQGINQGGHRDSAVS